MAQAERVTECPVCRGAGVYHGDGETCETCEGWGQVRMFVIGPHRPERVSFKGLFGNG